MRRRAEIERYLASRADQRVLRWFGHGKRIDDRVPYAQKDMLMGEIRGGRVHGRPRIGWMDGVKVALDNREMTEYFANPSLRMDVAKYWFSGFVVRDRTNMCSFFTATLI